MKNRAVANRPGPRKMQIGDNCPNVLAHVSQGINDYDNTNGPLKPCCSILQIIRIGGSTHSRVPGFSFLLTAPSVPGKGSRKRLIGPPAPRTIPSVTSVPGIKE
jgi:hypothetical protein